MHGYSKRVIWKNYQVDGLYNRVHKNENIIWLDTDPLATHNPVNCSAVMVIMIYASQADTREWMIQLATVDVAGGPMK